MTRILGLCFRAIAIGAVAVVLVLGLVNMMRRRLAAQKSQKLMSLRAAAIHRHHRHNADGLGDG
jgi:hypothetical protein